MSSVTEEPPIPTPEDAIRHLILIFPESKKRAKEFLKTILLPARERGEFLLQDAVVVKLKKNALSNKPHFTSLFDVETNRLKHAAKTGFTAGAMVGLLAPIFWPIIAATGTVSGVICASQERSGESQDLAELYQAQLLEILSKHDFSDRGSCLLLFWKRSRNPLALAQTLLGCGGVIVHTQEISAETAQMLQQVLDGDESAIQTLRRELELKREELFAPKCLNDPNSVAARTGYLRKNVSIEKDKEIVEEKQ